MLHRNKLATSLRRYFLIASGRVGEKAPFVCAFRIIRRVKSADRKIKIIFYARHVNVGFILCNNVDKFTFRLLTCLCASVCRDASKARPKNATIRATIVVSLALAQVWARKKMVTLAQRRLEAERAMRRPCCVRAVALHFVEFSPFESFILCRRCARHSLAAQNICQNRTLIAFL